MNLAQSILFGVTQGLTEFLPVSSDGHLVLARRVFGIGADPRHGIAAEIIAHLGTLLVIVLLFRTTLWRLARHGAWDGWTAMRRQGWRAAWWDSADGRLIVCIAAASVPTALIGLGIEQVAKEAFQSVRAAGVGLLVTTVFLAATFLRNEKGGELLTARPLGLWIAIAIGIAQGVAVLPGVSRSAGTLACALLLGMRRSEAFEFSFIIAVPAVAGATLLEAGDLFSPGGPGLGISAGILSAAFVSGLAALLTVRAVVNRGRIGWFAFYTLAVGLLGVFATG